MSNDTTQTERARFSPAFWVIVAIILCGVVLVVAVPHSSRIICKVRHIDIETSNILAALKLYRAEFGVFPGPDSVTILRALRGQNDRGMSFLDCRASSLYQTGELLDPWGTPYMFYRSGDEIATRSAGPNRRFEGSVDPNCDDYFR